ncbi:MAG: hypothetical protein WAK11_03730 [Candidatus Cybelea sp.]
MQSLLRLPSLPPILELGLSSAFAAAGSTPGCVLTFNGQSWQAAGSGLPSNLPFVSIDGPDITSIFVTNSQQVFVTHDGGGTWLIASNGLPSTANATELHYVSQPNGSAGMYLSTYGWSMFYAPLK